MVYFILSDDLTGAAGVASMVDHSSAATVNLDRFVPGLATQFGCIALNLEIRERAEDEAVKSLSRALELVGQSRVTVRIDSALRGHVKMLVGAMLERGEVMITDTIPEYGRRTRSGRTFMGGQDGDIESLLSDLRTEGVRKITIADSETYQDLDLLATECVERDLTPIDPGPLVSRVVRRVLGAGLPSSHLAEKVSRVAFVVGTRDPRSLEQVRYMSNLGFPVNEPRIKTTEAVDIFYFSLGMERSLVTPQFMDQLAGYDALVLSGGATASCILEESGFDYLVNVGQLQPLVSSSSIKGGLYDGKAVVLKGGFIGDDKTYMKILDWLRRE